jgi:FMN reductase
VTRILGVSSSQRKASRSRLLVERVVEQGRGFGAEGRLLDLRTTPLSMLQPEDYEASTNYETVREMVEWADALVLATPDYHGGMAAPIKNFLDHFWEEFAGKLFGFVIASHEKGLTVQDQLRTAVRQCYGWSLPYGIGFNGDKEMDVRAGTLEPKLEKRVRMMARDLVVYGALLRGQFRADLAAQPAPPSFAARFRED